MIGWREEGELIRFQQIVMFKALSFPLDTIATLERSNRNAGLLGERSDAIAVVHSDR